MKCPPCLCGSVVQIFPVASECWRVKAGISLRACEASHLAPCAPIQPHCLPLVLPGLLPPEVPWPTLPSSPDSHIVSVRSALSGMCLLQGALPQTALHESDLLKKCLEHAAQLSSPCPPYPGVTVTPHVSFSAESLSSPL